MLKTCHQFANLGFTHTGFGGDTVLIQFWGLKIWLRTDMGVNKSGVQRVLAFHEQQQKNLVFFGTYIILAQIRRSAHTLFLVSWSQFLKFLLHSSGPDRFYSKQFRHYQVVGGWFQKKRFITNFRRPGITCRNLALFQDAENWRGFIFYIFG